MHSSLKWSLNQESGLLMGVHGGADSWVAEDVSPHAMIELSEHSSNQMRTTL